MRARYRRSKNLEYTAVKAKKRLKEITFVLSASGKF